MMPGGVRRSVRSTALRATGRSGLGVRMCVRDPRHRGRVQLRRAQQSDIRGGHVSLEDVCAAGCAVQEGGRAVGEASSEHAAIAEERAMLCAVRPCCPDSHARHEQRGCGQALSWCPPHSTTQAAACRFVEESGAGVAGAGCDGAQSAADAISAAPPSGKCGGGAWPWLWAPERGDGLPIAKNAPRFNLVS